jgi:hypothetical protein
MPDQTNSAVRLRRIAPYVAALSFFVLAATTYANGILFYNLTAAPIAGAIAYLGTAICRRTRIPLLLIPSYLPLVLFAGKATAVGGMLWGGPQFFAVSLLIVCALGWLFGNLVDTWVSKPRG